MMDMSLALRDSCLISPHTFPASARTLSRSSPSKRIKPSLSAGITQVHVDRLLVGKTLDLDLQGALQLVV